MADRPPGSWNPLTQQEYIQQTQSFFGELPAPSNVAFGNVIPTAGMAAFGMSPVSRIPAPPPPPGPPPGPMAYSPSAYTYAPSPVAPSPSAITHLHGGPLQFDSGVRNSFGMPVPPIGQTVSQAQPPQIRAPSSSTTPETVDQQGLLNAIYGDMPQHPVPKSYGSKHKTPRPGHKQFSAQWPREQDKTFTISHALTKAMRYTRPTNVDIDPEGFFDLAMLHKEVLDLAPFDFDELTHVVWNAVNREQEPRFYSKKVAGRWFSKAKPKSNKVQRPSLLSAKGPVCVGEYSEPQDSVGGNPDMSDNQPDQTAQDDQSSSHRGAQQTSSDRAWSKKPSPSVYRKPRQPEEPPPPKVMKFGDLPIGAYRPTPRTTSHQGSYNKWKDQQSHSQQRGRGSYSSSHRSNPSLRLRSISRRRRSRSRSPRRNSRKRSNWSRSNYGRRKRSRSASRSWPTRKRGSSPQSYSPARGRKTKSSSTSSHKSDGSSGHSRSKHKSHSADDVPLPAPVEQPKASCDASKPRFASRAGGSKLVTKAKAVPASRTPSNVPQPRDHYRNQAEEDDVQMVIEDADQEILSDGTRRLMIESLKIPLQSPRATPLPEGQGVAHVDLVATPLAPKDAPHPPLKGSAAITVGRDVRTREQNRALLSTPLVPRSKPHLAPVFKEGSVDPVTGRLSSVPVNAVNDPVTLQVLGFKQASKQMINLGEGSLLDQLQRRAVPARASPASNRVDPVPPTTPADRSLHSTQAIEERDRMRALHAEISTACQNVAALLNSSRHTWLIHSWDSFINSVPPPLRARLLSLKSSYTLTVVPFEKKKKSQKSKVGNQEISISDEEFEPDTVLEYPPYLYAVETAFKYADACYHYLSHRCSHLIPKDDMPSAVVQLAYFLAVEEIPPSDFTPHKGLKVTLESPSLSHLSATKPSKAQSIDATNEEGFSNAYSQQEWDMFLAEKQQLKEYEEYLKAKEADSSGSGGSRQY